MAEVAHGRSVVVAGGQVVGGLALVGAVVVVIGDVDIIH